MMNIEFVEFSEVNEFEKQKNKEQQKKMMCNYENVRLDEHGYFGDALLVDNHQKNQHQQEKSVNCKTNMDFEKFVF